MCFYSPNEMIVVQMPTNANGIAQRRVMYKRAVDDGASSPASTVHFIASGDLPDGDIDD